MTQQDYIATLERDLLELPGQPYSRCQICGRLGITHNMSEKRYSIDTCYVCDCQDCKEKWDAMCEYYYYEHHYNDRVGDE